VETSLGEKPVWRYVATSIAVESIVSNALKLNRTILDERTPDLYRGCLHDFHRTRDTYIKQSQQPKLCEAEAKAIRSVFGEATVESLKNTLSRIALDE